jgi:hypothetical protein
MRTKNRIGNVVFQVLVFSALLGTLFVIGCGSGSGYSTSAPILYTVGGSVSRLVGSMVVLQDNNGNNLTVTADGPFTFTTGLASGTNYSVTVLTQPSNPGQICMVANGSGTVASAAITNVAVTCQTITTSLAVADFFNNRVLIYNTPFNTDQSANVVLGQANFTTATPGATANTMNGPIGVTADIAGNLYVSEDSANCRLLQFVPPFSNGKNASVVFGQPNLATANCPAPASISASSLGNSASTADQVSGAIVDSSGNLWVADAGANRVLEYKPPFTSGMAAVLVIGQANFTSGSPNQGGATPTNTSLSDPFYPIFDPSGNLWIDDFNNSRMLEFKPPFVTGMGASVVLGQADFTHGAGNQGGAVAANTMNGPGGEAFDSSGNLWMADFSNNRVLEFVPPFITNMPASVVLGQMDFTHGQPNQAGANPASATLSFPYQVSLDNTGRLFVSDEANNRTLVFQPPFGNGMNATLVIGQTSFTSGTTPTPPTPASQNNPTGVATAPPLY